MTSGVAHEGSTHGALPCSVSSDGADALSFIKHTKRGDKAYEIPKLPVPAFDTHAHLTCFWTKDPAEVLTRAARAGVKRLVTIFDPLADAMDARAFRERLRAWLSCGEMPSVQYLAGVHPYGAAEYSDQTHEQLLLALEDPLCAGIGEIGLDYHFDAVDDIEAAPHDVQIACFERQLSLAIERDLPVELHIRNDSGDAGRAAHADAYRVLQRLGLPRAGCVLHCFTEDRATMERFASLGCFIAFGGASTFKRNKEMREAFAACPLDRVLFETDCPYMAPEPVRGLECEPAMIAFTCDALAHDRSGRTGERPEQIMQAAWENACALFGEAPGLAR